MYAFRHAAERTQCPAVRSCSIRVTSHAVRLKAPQTVLRKVPDGERNVTPQAESTPPDMSEVLVFSGFQQVLRRKFKKFLRSDAVEYQLTVTRFCQNVSYYRGSACPFPLWSFVSSPFFRLRSSISSSYSSMTFSISSCLSSFTCQAPFLSRLPDS